MSAKSELDIAADAVKRALDAGRDRRRVHHLRRRGILRQRAHAGGRKPEGSRLARRWNSRAGRASCTGLVLHSDLSPARHRVHGAGALELAKITS